MKENGERAAGSVSIREMQLKDIQPVFELGGRLFTADQWPTLYRSWDETELVDLFGANGQYCLVAESRNRVIGFALGSMMRKPRNPWCYGWLLWLGVVPRLKLRGIGTRLVNQLTDRFIENGARILLVDTDANNESAIQFFKKAGYGNELMHVYMSCNLESHPKYIQRKAERETENKD